MNEENLGPYDIIWVGVLDDDNFYTPVSHRYSSVFRGDGCLPIFQNKEECQTWCDAQPKEHNYFEDYYLTEQLLKELNSRGGFDGWWGNLDEDIQLEIKTKLASIIKDYQP